MSAAESAAPPYRRRVEATHPVGELRELLRLAVGLPLLAEAGVVVSTVPADAADSLVGVRFTPDAVVLDVLYHPWPTPLAAAAAEAGCRVVSGRDLLLYQAVRQVTLMTGLDAPVDAMRDALTVSS